MINHVFVYGTLLPGDVRWRYLAQFVSDEGVADSVGGSLFDTGFDYPAAVFDDSGTILGRTFAVARRVARRLPRACSTWRRTPSVAGTDGSPIRTHRGTEVWSYEYGFGLDLTPIPSGDWLAHRPAHLALELTDD